MPTRATAGRRQLLDTLADQRRRARHRALTSTESYLQYSPLIGTLPALVRQQRRYEARIAAVAQAVQDEKAVRGQIDQLLLAAGLRPGESVTCLGYAVTHHQRDGQARLREELLIPQLVLLEIAPDVIDAVISNSTETGPPSCYATVKPAKGSTVRA